MSLRFPASLILLVLTVLLSGCASYRIDPAEIRGHLVIVGGGLKDDNAAIHTRFVELCAPGPIGIIPIASGEGLNAGEEAAAVWRQYANNRPVIVIPLTKDNATKADDPAIAAQIVACGGLWFTGGDQSRVTAVLKPANRSTRTACLAACFTVLNRDGVIGGTSAGAAIMSNPMIAGGQSPGRPSLAADDDNTHVRLSPGLGFLKTAMTDQHFLQRGRMGRLIDALQEFGDQSGFGISENCALVITPSTYSPFEPIGDRAVCELTRHESYEPGAARLGIYSTGDLYGTPAHGLVRAASRIGLLDSGFHDEATAPDPWDFKTMNAALDLFTQERGTVIRRNDRVTVTIIGDSNTRVYVDPEHRRPAYVSNLLIKVQPTAKIASAGSAQ